MKSLTKNRAALLRLFFTNPEESYYMQEIGRILDKKPGTFQRTLNNLVAEGIVESEYKAHARFFKVNKKYFLFSELKNIVFKTVGITGSIRDRLKEVSGIKLAFIYGSYAYDNEHRLSDIDLAIVGTPDEDILVKALDKLEEILQRDINYKLYTVRAFKEDIKRKEPFLLEIVAGNKVFIIGDSNELHEISQG